MKEKMKKKCRFCNTIFTFKIKDLIPIQKEFNSYKINCNFCYSEKIIILNPKEKNISTLQDNLEILQDYLEKESLTKTSNLINDFSKKYRKAIISNKRKSRIEMISTYKNEKDILDNILNKSIVRQLVKPITTKNHYSIGIITIILFNLIFIPMCFALIFI